MSDPRTDLPSDKSSNFTARVRETLQTYLGKQGNPLDRGLTLRDLLDAGLLAIKDGFQLRPGQATLPIGPGSGIDNDNAVYVPDLTPPPTPTGFAAAAAISNLLLETDAPIYTQGHGHLATVIYGAIYTSGPLPTFDDAIQITEFPGNISSHATNPATTWHLWVKWKSNDGVLSTSPAGGTNGVVVTTGQDVSLLLEALAGQISSSQLASDLSTPIGQIPGISTVASNALAQANANLASIGTMHAELSAISGTPDYDNATTYAVDAIVKYSGGLYRATATTTGNLPTNTTYWQKIGDYASLGDAVSAHSAQLSDHETRIDTAEGGLTAVASRATALESTVNNATTGVSATATALTAMGTRVTSVEGVNTTQSTSITSLNNSVTTINDTLATKASATALSDLTTRVTNAEGVNTSQATSLTNLNSSLTTTNTNVTTAQTTANTAVTNAATAQTAANTANTLLADIASDAKLTPVEKQSVRSEWGVISGEKAGLNTQATTFSVTTENTNYNTAFQALATYLNAGAAWSSGIPSWISDANLSVTTTIVGATFRTNFANYYAARTALLNAIALKAKTLADAASTLAGTKADASALTTTNTNVTNLSGVVTAQGTRVTNLETSVNNATTGLSTKASVAYVDTAKADAVSAAATASQTLVSGLNTDLSAAISTEASTRASQTGELYAQYTVKTDVAGMVSGYGLASTANNAAPTSAFGVQAGQFFVGPPTVAQSTAPTANLYKGFVWRDTTTNATKYYTGSAWSTTPQAYPFVVQATPTTINGVSVPAGVYMADAYIQNGTITNAKIGNAAIDDAKISSVSAGKLTAGTIGVSNYIQSTGYVTGSAGWKINGDGTAEFSGVVVRGTVYATAGQIGGITIASNAVQAGQTAYNSGSGFYLGADGTMSLGNSAGNRLTWDGTNIEIISPKLTVANGGAIFSGDLLAANGTFSGVLNGATGEFAGTLRAGVLDFSKLNGVTVIYDVPGTYTLTVPSGKNRLLLTLYGGGGGGGGGSSRQMLTYAGGGGGSGYVSSASFAVSAGQQFTLVVGGGGGGGGARDGIYSSGSNGGTGGTTSVAGLLSAAGGGGGLVAGNSPTGGVGANNGQSGGVTTDVDPANYDYYGISIGGNGASSPFGTGGIGAMYDSNYYWYASPNHSATASPSLCAGGGGGSQLANFNADLFMGKAGGGGYAVIEYSDGNAVVLTTAYTILLSALQRQGIATA